MPALVNRETEAKWQLEYTKGGFKIENKSLLSVRDGIGIIDISGPLMRKPSLYMQVIENACDFAEINAAIREAGERDDVKAVALLIDSPGGTVNGTPECGAAIAALSRKKYVYAYSEGLMCSAAYWLASQCDAVLCSHSAIVGSIGVILAVPDVRGLYEKFGVKMEVFTSGKFKGAGTPGTSLSDAQKELLQARVDAIGVEFRAAVRARGRKIPDSAMEGQTFSGIEAQRLNIAGRVTGFGEVITRLSSLRSNGIRNGGALAEALKLTTS